MFGAFHVNNTIKRLNVNYKPLAFKIQIVNKSKTNSMFFIFGWNHQKVTSYGSVEQIECDNCHNTEYWQLSKITKYFTLFFIPIFPHEHIKIYYCPICKNATELDKEFFEFYKSIAEINLAYSTKTISGEERSIKLQAIYSLIEKVNDAKLLKYTEESKDWVKLASEKSNFELANIINGKKDEYNPAFVIAVAAEIEKRKSKNA